MEIEGVGTYLPPPPAPPVEQVPTEEPREEPPPGQEKTYSTYQLDEATAQIIDILA